MKDKINIIMFASILVLMGGFFTALIGVVNDMHWVSYFGMGLMVATCVTWWFWVMVEIRSMLENLENTSKGLVEVKRELRTVMEVLRELFSRKEDK